MAPATIVNAVPIFPVGTSVGAYLKGQWAGGRADGAPSGAAVQSVAVAAGGTLTYTALADDQDYVLYANVGGQDRYINLSTRGNKNVSGERELAYAEKTDADFTTTSTTAVTITGLAAVTFQAVGKPIVLEVGSGGIANSAASLTTMEVWEAGNSVWTGPILTHTAGQTFPSSYRFRLGGARAPSNGSHTWELRVGVTGFGSGTLTLKRNTQLPIFIRVLEVQ